MIYSRVTPGGFLPVDPALLQAAGSVLPAGTRGLASPAAAALRPRTPAAASAPCVFGWFGAQAALLPRPLGQLAPLGTGPLAGLLLAAQHRTASSRAEHSGRSGGWTPGPDPQWHPHAESEHHPAGTAPPRHKPFRGEPFEGEPFAGGDAPDDYERLNEDSPQQRFMAWLERLEAEGFVVRRRGGGAVSVQVSVGRSCVGRLLLP